MTSRLQTWLGAALIGVLAVGALASTAGHATTVTNRLLSSEQQRDAMGSNAYYSCLEAKGHQLIGPNDRVYVAQANLDSWVKLTKALGGWAHLQEHRAHATVAVVLANEPARVRGSICNDGQHKQSLITIRTTSTGRVVMAGGPSAGNGTR